MIESPRKGWSLISFRKEGGLSPLGHQFRTLLEEIRRTTVEEDHSNHVKLELQDGDKAFVHKIVLAMKSRRYRQDVQKGLPSSVRSLPQCPAPVFELIQKLLYLDSVQVPVHVTEEFFASCFALGIVTMTPPPDAPPA